MNDTAVYLVRKGDTATLVLNRPSRRNAISGTMWETLPGLLREAAEDSEVRLLKVTGAGDHFAAGADISEFETVYSTAESSAQYATVIADALGALEEFAKPTLAVIRGSCVGGGVSIAAACDLRVAERSARFAVTPGKLGLVYPYDDVRRLVRLVGEAGAMDLLLSGRLIGAEEALRIRLVNRVSDDVEKSASELQDDILSNSQWSAQATKMMIGHVARGDRSAGQALFLSGFEGEDFQTGFRAFLAKEKPGFKWRA